jgi:4-amino-4-deoxychorismate lyase
MVIVNGVETDAVSVRDRGLTYGDGVFRTLRAKGGRLLDWDRHYHKLVADCARIAITCPPHDEIATCVAQSARVEPDGVVKIIVTRGLGLRGYRAAENTSPTLIVIASAAPPYAAENRARGVAVRVCKTPASVQPRLAGVKTLNRLDNVLARMEWDDPGIAEGLMLDPDGNLIEGTMSNVFCVQDGTLCTPSLERCGVAGVQRDKIIEHAQRESIGLQIKAIPLTEALAADEMFVCNSLIGVWPVARLGAKRWAPGAITRALATVLSNADDGPRA